MSTKQINFQQWCLLSNGRLGSGCCLAIDSIGKCHSSMPWTARTSHSSFNTKSTCELGPRIWQLSSEWVGYFFIYWCLIQYWRGCWKGQITNQRVCNFLYLYIYITIIAIIPLCFSSIKSQIILLSRYWTGSHC